MNIRIAVLLFVAPWPAGAPAQVFQPARPVEIVVHTDVPTLREAGYNVHSDPTIRGVVAPPGTARNVAAYWEEVFARMVKPDAWRRYLEENQFEDGFQRGDALVKSSAEFVARMREMLQDAGLEFYR